jgi:polyhydroxyalkanoate synthesis regulator protein
VDAPAKESDYDYGDDAQAVMDTLTDWNVKNFQTHQDVVKELKHPRYTDAVKNRRNKFKSMTNEQLRAEAKKYGITMNGHNTNTIIARLIHATL